MDNIHVVLDSTANVSAELLQKYKNLHQVSLKVMLADKEWNETDLTAPELFAEMKNSGMFPKTSQPALGDFIAVFQQITQAGGKIIVITVAGGLSGTVEGAKTAARMVSEKDIYVIDSQTTLSGMIHLAENALDMAARGVPIADIVHNLHARVKVTHTLLLPDSLEHLHRGGRIGGAAAVFGTILQIKPILHLAAGKIVVLDKVRTRAKAIRRMEDELAKCKNLDYIGVAHIGAEAEALREKEQLARLYPSVRISLMEAGPVLAAHVGPATFALIYQEKIG